MYNNFNNVFSWLEVLEHQYSLSLRKSEEKVVPVDNEAQAIFQEALPGWNLEIDETLVQFLCEFSESDNEHLGSIKNFVESIEVSSQSVKYGHLRLFAFFHHQAYCQCP